MKKFISLFLSIVMLLSITAGLDLSAAAYESDADNYTSDRITDIGFYAKRDLIYGFDVEVPFYEDGEEWFENYVTAALGAEVTFDDGFVYDYDFAYRPDCEYDDDSNLNYEIYNNLVDFFENVFFIYSYDDAASGNSMEIRIDCADDNCNFTYNNSVWAMVVENPVESITFTDDENVQISETYKTEIDNSYYDESTDEWIDSTFWGYDYYTKDAVIKYKDGRTVEMQEVCSAWTFDGYSSSYFIRETPAGTVLPEGTDVHGNARHQIEYISNQAENNWLPGNTYPVTVSYLGVKATYYVDIIESNIADISYTPVKPYVFYENVYGYMWDDNWDGAQWFEYYGVGPEEGDILTITYKDGTVEDAVCSCYKEELEELVFVSSKGNIIYAYNDLDWSDNQWGEHWTVGGDNYTVISYAGIETTVPVTILENPVSSIQYKPQKPVEFVEGINFAACDDGYASFIMPSFIEDGDVLTVTYKDGSTKDFYAQWRENFSGEKTFVSEDGEDIADDRNKGYYYSADITDGDGNLLDKGIAYIDYMGYTAEIFAPIVTDIVESMVYTPVSPVSISEDTMYSYETEDENGKTYRYYYDWIIWEDEKIVPFVLSEGDKLTVNYKDGSSVDYYLSNEWEYGIVFSDSDGNNLILNRTNTNQETDHWTIGGDNWFSFTYMGVESNRVPVEIVTNTCDHSFEWVLRYAATIEDEGVLEHKCTQCGYVDDVEYIASPTEMKLSRTSYEYTGKDIGPGVTVKDSSGNTLKYKTDYTLTYDEGRKDVGTYGVTIHFIGNYDGTETLCFDITPKPAGKCTAKLSATEYAYTGKDIGPGVSVVDDTGRKLVYKTDYTLTYDQGRTEPGTYSVVVNYIGNYSGSETLYFTIKEPVKFTAKLSATKYTYTGRDIGPGVTVTDSTGKKLVYKTDYTLTYAAGRTNVGRYGVTVNYIGKYAGTPSETLYFDIVAKSASQCTAKPSAWSYYYTGKDIGPGVTVTDNTGRKLAYKTDYTLTYDQGRTNVGRYSIKVNYIGNYTGSQTIYFYIIPKQVTFKSLTPIKQGFTVSWNTQPKEITGYQVQYSRYSNFSNSATLTFANPSTSSVTRNYMGANKKYYVRIRTYKYVTVDGKTTTLFSGWSEVKTVTTNK